MNKKTCHRDVSACPIAHALDVIGDKWTLLVVRDLLFNNLHEYKDFLNASEGISTNILSERLQKLGEFGLISSIPHPESGIRKLYYLTETGKKLVFPMIEIARWANDSLQSMILPPEKEKLLNKPKELAKLTLQQTAVWEKEFLAKGRKASGR